MSPEEAAQRAGVSRRTIARAVQRQEIKAVRDNRNRWRIDVDSLDAWALPRLPSGQFLAHAQEVAHGEHLATIRERDELRLQLAGRDAELAGVRELQRAEVAGVRELLRAVEADRDMWRDLARQPWWQRLLGSRQR